MKIWITALTLTLTTLAATAQTYVPAIPMRDTPAIEEAIREKLKQQLGFGELQNFFVDWRPNSLKCLEVQPSELDPEKVFRLCSINVSAFQVEAKAAIIKKDGGYDISIIYAHVE